MKNFTLYFASCLTLAASAQAFPTVDYGSTEMAQWDAGLGKKIASCETSISISDDAKYSLRRINYDLHRVASGVRVKRVSWRVGHQSEDTEFAKVSYIDVQRTVEGSRHSFSTVDTTLPPMFTLVYDTTQKEGGLLSMFSNFVKNIEVQDLEVNGEKPFTGHCFVEW